LSKHCSLRGATLAIQIVFLIITLILSAFFLRVVLFAVLALLAWLIALTLLSRLITRVPLLPGLSALLTILLRIFCH
jgi:hypothetical protein